MVILEIASSALATLFAAFGGAYWAFHLNRRQDVDDQKKRNVEATNEVLFALFEQLNTIYVYKRDILDPVRDEEGRHIAIRPVIASEFRDIRLPIERIQFLATPKSAQILFDLSVEQSRFDSTIGRIKVLSDLLLTDIQSKLAEAGILSGETVYGGDVEKILGNRLHEFVRSTTDQVYREVDRSVDSLQGCKKHLRETVLKVYPDAPLIDFVLTEPAQHNAAADHATRGG